jgi:PPK2 family polyphosphate:nucleotide phosphotransferase
MTDLCELLAAQPGKLRLADVDPRGMPGLPESKAIRKDAKLWSRTEVASISEELASYQEKLYASAKEGSSEKRVLLLLQAMDCGGKDGTISSVLRGLNPAGIKAVSFGAPTEEERQHHYLWRIHRALPPAGYLGVFNRSHYEDVLVVRVHELVPEDVWASRYDEINAFEAEQVASGLTIVKVMLHISREEQKRRLIARLEDPAKQWKYDPGDLAERSRWDDYQRAYDDAINKCNTSEAPWYVVPADRKWYRNWAVANLLRSAFRSVDPQYPVPDFDVDPELAKLREAP